MLEQKFLINGEWYASPEKKLLASPYNGEPIAEVYQATPMQIQQSLTAAQQAFAVTKKLPAHKVAEILLKVRDGVAAHAEDFSRTLALEAGKPIRTARIEVARAQHTLELGAAECQRLHGEVLPMDLRPHGENRFGFFQRVPLGVVSAITPFNFPLNLVAHKVAPSLAARNAMVLRPASQTPLTAFKLGKLVLEAGWPEGGLNVVTCPAALAEQLIVDERVKLVTFTGSPAVGWELKKKGFKKRVSLELGGNAGVIVHDDANLEAACSAIVTGGFSYAGQSCISVQRVLLHEKIFEACVDLLIKKTNALVCGDPLDEKTDIGPMINKSEAERAEAWIKEAAANGAKVLCGGERNGAVLRPTILTNTKPNMKVNCQEIFGPAITVEKYSDFKQAVQLVDDSAFGLQAGVFTRDLERVRHAFEHIEVGGLMVNEVPTWRIDHMPYGGVKESGNTREGVRYAIEEMTEMKLMVVKFEGI